MLDASEPRAIRRIELIGIVPILLVGSLLHFAFAWTGELAILALVAAVNESVWEHLKLGFWPSITWGALVWALYRPDPQRYWPAKALALLLMPTVVCGLYYGYRAVLGHNVLVVDISIFVIAVIVGQASIPLVLRVPTPMLAGSSLLLIHLLAFSLFTFLPPHLPIFRDQRNGLYGIEAGQVGKRAHPVAPIEHRSVSDSSSD